MVALLACVSVQMRRASQALAELNQQQKAVALGGSSKARYREAQVGAANECARRLENCKLSELQDQIAVLQEQLEIDQEVQMVCSVLIPLQRDSRTLPPPSCNTVSATACLTKQSYFLEQRKSFSRIRESLVQLVI